MESFQSRNVLLVIIWSYGLFIFMHFYQYIGIAIAAKYSKQNFEAIIKGEFTSGATDLIISVVAILVGIPLVFIAARFLWGRNFEWMRFQLNGKQLLFGLVLGLLLPLVIVLILKMLGFAKITWQLNNIQTGLGITILGYACLAIFTGIAEEVVFRGMATREIALQYGWAAAIIIGGLFFGLAHILPKLNKITMVEAAWILFASILASFLFVSMYIRGQSLWLPIGFHIAWNFCLQGIMGIAMSGNEAKASLLSIELYGNQIFTGGGFGIESSIISLGLNVIIAIAFLKIPWNGIINILGAK